MFLPGSGKSSGAVAKGNVGLSSSARSCRAVKNPGDSSTSANVEEHRKKRKKKHYKHKHSVSEKL